MYKTLSKIISFQNTDFDNTHGDNVNLLGNLKKDKNRAYSIVFSQVLRAWLLRHRQVFQCVGVSKLLNIRQD